MPQTLITKPMHELHLISKEEAELGICNGITAAFAIAALSGDYNRFIKTIRFMDELETNTWVEDVLSGKPNRKESIITEKIIAFKTAFIEREKIKDEKLFEKILVEEYDGLLTEEQMIVNCLILFKVINLFQSPDKYTRYLLNKKWSQKDFESISKIIAFKALSAEDDLVKFYCRSLIKQGGLKEVYADEMLHTPIEWCGILEECRLIMEKTQSQTSATNLVISLSLYIEGRFKHAIALFYDFKNQCWVVNDANNLPTKLLENMDEQYSDRLLHGKKEPQHLPAKAIFHNGFVLDTQQQIFSTLASQELIAGDIQIFTTNNNPQLKILQKAFSTLKKTQRPYCPAMPLLLQRKDGYGETLLHKSVIKDDLLRVKQYAHLNADIKEESKHGYSPVFYAALHNAKKCIQFFAKNNHRFDLNQTSSDKNTVGYLKTPAFVAAKYNNHESLEILAKAGADLEKASTELQKADNNKYTPLHVAAFNNALRALKVLINPKYKVNLNPCDSWGITPVYEAVKQNHPGAVKLLADAGADLNKTQRNDLDTPLHEAVRKKSIKTVKLLTLPHYHVDLNRVNLAGETPLLIAAYTKQELVFGHLLDKGADLRITDRLGWTVLHAAVGSGSKAIIERICHAIKMQGLAIDINQEDPNGETPATKMSSNITIVKCLATCGFDLARLNKRGWAPLHIAIQNNTVDVAEFLMQAENQIDLNQVTKEGYTAAAVAAKYHRLDLLKKLELLGADLEKPDNEGLTPLMHAILNQDSEIAQYLISKTKNINYITKYGKTTATIAVSKNNLTILEILIQAGADLNLGKLRDMPLMIAAEEGYDDALRMILQPEHRVDINQTLSDDDGPADTNHLTAAILAAANNHPSVLEQLITAGADLSKTTDNGNTALHWSAETNAHRSISTLLKYQIDINQRNKAGETSVYISAANNQLKALRQLIIHQANLNIADLKGTTPLHIATQKGHLHVVKFLLEQKINPLILDNEKHSAFYYAIQNKHWDMVRLFIHVLKFKQYSFNSEDRALIIAHEQEIMWNYYSSASSLNKGEYSPLIAMLMKNSALYRQLEQNTLKQFRDKNRSEMPSGARLRIL